MCDYQNGRIYKIVNDIKPNELYCGSTVAPLCVRLGRHRSDSKVEKNQSRRFYQFVRELGGWHLFRIVLVENYPCNNKEELHAREEYWRKGLKATLNTYRPHGYVKEVYQKSYQVKYRAEKPLKIKELKKKSNTHRLSVKFQCLCGGEYSLHSKSAHMKTGKHQKYSHQADNDG